MINFILILITEILFKLKSFPESSKSSKPIFSVLFILPFNIFQMNKNQNKQNPDSRENKDELPGYPVYPSDEDIFQKEKKVALDESEITGQKKNKSDPGLDEGLDVPGAELDDANELIGEEDEENNYYSLGGDNHSDLDEN